MKGESNVKCDIRISLSEEWSEFSCNVDNVGNLGIGSATYTIRVVTRSQDKESIQCNWLQGYSNQEIENFQREDMSINGSTTTNNNQVELRLLRLVPHFDYIV